MQRDEVHLERRPEVVQQEGLRRLKVETIVFIHPRLWIGSLSILPMGRERMQGLRLVWRIKIMELQFAHARNALLEWAGVPILPLTEAGYISALDFRLGIVIS